MKAIRDAYGQYLKECGDKNKDIVVFDADVSSSTKSAIFGSAFPDRFFNMGVSEANMMGYAAGISTMGKIPFVNTFAIFMMNRGADVIRNIICYGKLNVKLAGGYAGMSDSFDGATHHAIEDISYMRVLPNMKVIVPCDVISTEELTRIAIETNGPVYIRLSRDVMPDLYDGNTEFKLGGSHTVREGSDYTIFAYGYMVHKSLEAAKILEEKHKLSIRVIDMYSIKPLDTEAIIKASKETKGLITVEEHLINGGLGSCVAEVVAENCPTKVKRIGLNDTFSETGAYEKLLAKYGINTEQIVEQILDFIK